MKYKRGLAIVTGSLMLLVAVPAMAFNYTEGWDRVSAPPPPGPYRAVNLDPRIPGQDTFPLMPTEEPSAATGTTGSAVEIPAEALLQPPAAGRPTLQPLADRPAASPGQPASQPPARGYNRAMPRPPAYGYPAPPQGYSGYPGYRNMPSTGYSGAPARRLPQQVPPPPVYDAMMKNRQPYGNQNSQGTP